MKKFLKKRLFLIFILALTLRFYKLDIFPYGLHVDEVKVGWNAYSIFKTGLDDNGNFLSLYYNSFGDFRPTGIFYLTIPSILIFGKSIFAIRFMSSLLGAMTVIPIYLISKNVLRKNYHLLASFLLAISPWHIMVSRATSEVVISMFFALFAIYFYTQIIKINKVKYIIYTLFFLHISYLLYHSIRLLAPIFILILFIYNKKTKATFYTLLGTICLSLIFLTTNGSVSRLNQISIKKDIDYQYELTRLNSESPNRKLFRLLNNEKIVYIKRFIYQYGSYFSTDFLIGNSARPNRYTTPGAGLLGYVEFILVICGVYFLIKNKQSKIFLILLLAAPLPAAFTTEDAPNLHRSLFMIPYLVILASYGLSNIKYFRSLITLLIICNFTYFGYMYLYHSYNHIPFIKNYSIDSPTYRNIGAIELSKKLDDYANKYGKIIISNFPDSIYPWYAFLTNKSPKTFNKHVFNNIVFTNDKCASDNSFDNYKDENILVIDSWQCGVESKIKDGLPVQIVDTIKRPDGSVVYLLLSRK